MEVLLAATLALVGFIVLLSFLMNRYAAFWYKTLVADQMAIINAIVLTEEAPPSWRVPMLDAAARRGDSPFWRKIRLWLDAGHIRRLDRLMKSIATSSYLSDDEKIEFVEALEQIRSDWVQQAVEAAGLTGDESA